MKRIITVFLVLSCFVGIFSIIFVVQNFVHISHNDRVVDLTKNVQNNTHNVINFEIKSNDTTYAKSEEENTKNVPENIFLQSHNFVKGYFSRDEQIPNKYLFYIDSLNEIDSFQIRMLHYVKVTSIEINPIFDAVLLKKYNGNFIEIAAGKLNNIQISNNIKNDKGNPLLFAIILNPGLNNELKLENIFLDPDFDSIVVDSNLVPKRVLLANVHI
ncbi:MAG: hypothetical protein NZZ41_03385 [Candidatus Dojkabacteria bacterium]|nr:hypothetical protein [Candidatus Dojkabacteria bacterium]